MPFIDYIAVKGRTTSKTCHIDVTEDDGITFKPLDLNPYSVRFRILGSATADAKVLVEHLITQNSLESEDGVISDPSNGDFTITVTKEDTNIIGLGNHPIDIVLLDAETLEEVYALTEGGTKGEFNKIQVVQV